MREREEGETGKRGKRGKKRHWTQIETKGEETVTVTKGQLY